MPIQFEETQHVQKDTVTVVVYGPPGVGKTSLALTATNPVLLDFDKGVHRAGWKLGQSIQIHQWKEIDALNAADLAPFDTVIIDTVGTCLEVLAAHLRAQNPKLYGRGDLTLKGYGALKGEFASFLSTVTSAGKDIVMVAHSEEQQRGDEMVDRIVAMGGSRSLIYRSADLIGYLSRTEPRACTLSFNPSTTSYGKNTNLEDFTIPDPALGQGEGQLAAIISQCKANINAEIARGVEDQAAIDALRAELATLDKTPEAYTARLQEMRQNGAPVTHGRILVDMGHELGFVYDREKTAFTQDTDAAQAQLETPGETTQEPEQTDAPPAPAQPPAPEAPAEPEPAAEACNYCKRTNTKLIDAVDQSGNKQCEDYDSCMAEFEKVKAAASAG